MIDERQPITLGRKADLADPASSLVEYFSDRIFKPDLAVDRMCHSQRRAVRRPIRLLDIAEQVARSIRADRKLSQGSNMQERIVTDPKISQHRHLSGWRNRQHFCIYEAKIAGLRRIGRTDEDRLRIPLP